MHYPHVFAKSMRSVLSLSLLAVATLLGFSWALAAPTTTITPNGFGTSAPLSSSPGYYNIQGGTTVGSNLFHSFSTFNLSTGDTADFNVTSGISNIFARVTGGPSTIDGTITSTIGAGGPISSANLFLINPAGVMFTANAQVNLGGSFIVSTASYAKFNDGTYFYGDVDHPIADAGLTSAPVSAFGFLTTAPQPVSFAGSKLAMLPGTGLHVIAGGITVDQGSPDGVNEQGSNLSAPSGNLTLFSAASAGEVPFGLASPGAGYAAASVSALGNITIQNQSNISISGIGGGNVVIRGGKVVVDNSNITSFNNGSVAGGNIAVKATELSVSSDGVIGTDTLGTASAGGIRVAVESDLHISGTGSQISANTDSAGNGGLVAVAAGSIDLDDGSIFANVARSTSTGQGGMVTVNAGAVSMEGHGSVSSLSNGPGNAGTVALTLSGPLTMSDQASIAADTYTAASGGDITVTAGQVTMTGQSLISSNTFFGSGNSGKVAVHAGSLSILGTGTQPPDSLGILAQTYSAGNAGTIFVDSGNLSLAGAAIISSSSLGFGNGGTVSVNCSQGSLSGRSTISASSVFTSAGSVQVSVNDSFTLSSGSSINTSAGVNGGDVTLKVGTLLYLIDSNIEAYAGVVAFPGQHAGGMGGNILIDPEFVVLDNSLISANDLSGIGQDGNITNLANYFFTTDSILHATGTIETTPPDLDLSASLAFLPANLVDAQKRLRESCARSLNHEFSTFVVVGRGGTEAAPEELQSDFGLSHDPIAPEGRKTPSVDKIQTGAQP